MTWLDDIKGTASEKAQAAALATATAALGRSLDALSAAVDQVRERHLGYEVTVGVALGPVSLSVTVPAGGEE